MFTSFSTALSALSAHSTALDVVGNNLANLNTPGYKASVAYFHDLMTESLGGALGETQVGLGVGKASTVRQFTQGSIQGSTGLLDGAIQGDGYFVVRDSQSRMLYTRAGNFRVDSEGRLLTNTGERVQGWNADVATGSVNTGGAIGDIVVPVGKIKQPVATSQITLDVNLNASAAADATSKFTTPLEVYDSLGTSHVLTVEFTKTGENAWSYQVYIPGDEVDAGTAGTPYAIPNASGDVEFTEEGLLRTPDADADPISIVVPDLVSGANELNINWDLYTPEGASRLTQFGEPSAPSGNSQNGSPATQLLKVGLADGGRIMAQYSNGQQVQVGQLAMASIRNPESLVGVGNNNFQVTAHSAEPAIGVPGTGGRGEVVGGALESSTVDIAREFTNLMVFQRGYQANSRVITTQDELSQEIMNLKR